MSKGLISEIKVTGDFFGKNDVSELEALIKDTDIKKIYEIIKSVDVGEYIFGMKNEEFLQLIKE